MRLSIVSAIAALFVLSPFQAFAESEEELGAMCDAAWALMWSADTSPQDLEKAEALLTQVAEHWTFVHSDLGLIALRLHNDTAAAAHHFEIAGNAGTGLADRYLAQMKVTRMVPSADPLAEAAFLLERGGKDPSCWDCLYRVGEVAMWRGDFAKASEFWHTAAAAKGDPMAADALATAIAAGHIASSDPKVEASGWRILAGLRFGRADEVETRLRQEGVPDDILAHARAWAAERLRDFPKASP